MPADEKPPLDRIDRQIAGLLAEQGRMSVAEIASAVSLSRSATSERIRRLERSGYIVGYRAEINPALAGRGLEATVDAKVLPGADRALVEAWLSRQPAVFEAVHLTGAYDYMIRARCGDSEQLDRLVTAMKREAHIAETETRVILGRLPVSPDIVGDGRTR